MTKPSYKKCWMFKQKRKGHNYLLKKKNCERKKIQQKDKQNKTNKRNTHTQKKCDIKTLNPGIDMFLKLPRQVQCSDRFASP